MVPSFAKSAKLGQPQLIWCWQRWASPPTVNLSFYVHITVPGTVDDNSVTFHFGPFSSMEEGRAMFPVITQGLLDGYLLWVDQEPHRITIG